MHLRTAVIQVNARDNPAENLATVERFLDRAAQMGAQFVSLPEFWTYLGPYSGFEKAGQSIPGPEVVTAEIDGITFGLSICYDLRFPELYRALALRGAQILLVPAGFTLHTGRDHWEVLLRARAIENLCYVVAAAQVGHYPPNRQCFGRSMVIDPWGLVLAQAQDVPTVIATDIDLFHIDHARAQIPSLENRRPSAYQW